METFCDDQDKREKSLNLITHVEVEPAHNSDANALVPAIEATEEQNLKPQELIADSLYGSDDNCEYAKEHKVELIAPAMSDDPLLASGVHLGKTDINRTCRPPVPATGR